MSFADSSQTRLAYVAESTEGVTPTSPSFTKLRYTRETLSRRKDTITSEEINDHANVSDLIMVGRAATGNVDGELSYGTYDALFESLLRSTWSANVLKNGTTPKSFTFEKTFEQGATDSFIRYVGCRVNSLTLAVTARQIATVSFGILGRGGSSGTTALAGATYAEPNTNPVINAASHVGSLLIAGVSPSPRILGLTLNVSQNLREQPEVGSMDLAGIGHGLFEVTGSMDVYFESLAMYEAIHDNSDLGLTFTIGASAGSKYTFDIPRIKMTGGEPQVGGNNQDVRLPIEFRGLYDVSGSPANNCTLMITRAVS